MPTRLRRTPPPGCCCDRGSPSACSATWPTRASCRPCCAACRTTSPPRWISSCGGWPAGSAPTRVGRGVRRRESTAAAGAGVPRPGRCRRSPSTGSPASCAATGTARSPRSTSACPAGRDDPSHMLGVLANYLRLDDPDLAPDAPVRRRRAAAEAMIDRAVGRAPAPAGRLRGPRRRLRPAPGAAADRAAGEPEVPAGRRARGRSAPSCSGSATRAGRAAARIDGRDDIFFLDLAEARRGARRRADRRIVVRRTAGGVRGRAAPPPHPAGAAVRRHRAGGRWPDGDAGRTAPWSAARPRRAR